MQNSNTKDRRLESISVVVCTFKRPLQLADCVSELVRQAREIPGTEVIIVDNNSGDSTADVATGLIRQHPGLVKYVLETKPGPCFARNRGRKEAAGRILGFLDDDAIPHTNWLTNINNYFREGIGHMVTGRVVARPVGGLPDWFPDNLRWVLAEYAYGDQRHEIVYPDQGFPACNFAVSTEAFDRIGGFNERLRIYGEEVDFFKSLRDAGYKAHYDPAISIDHCPDVSRMSKRSLLRKAFDMGRGVGALHWIHDPHRATSNYIRAARFLKQGLLLTLGWLSHPARFDRGFTAMMNYGSSYQSIFGRKSGYNVE